MKTILTMLLFLVVALVTLGNVSASDSVNPLLPQIEVCDHPAPDSALFPENTVEFAVVTHPLPIRSSYGVTHVNRYTKVLHIPDPAHDTFRYDNRITPASFLSSKRLTSTGFTYGASRVFRH